jgi:phosphatidylserine/phosphatidylglycerophosphate/cardiolipin synthase-like enzyme
MVSVGSTNTAPRSFHLNDEANLNNYAAACQKNFWSMPRRSSAQL